MSVVIACDFDGTISLGDVTDGILERFAPPEWRTIEAKWLAGELSARECMARQVALIDANQAELDAYLDAVIIDPTFADFARKFDGIPSVSLLILSDGLDYAIYRILAKNGLADLTVMANAFVPMPQNRYRLDFPHGAPYCIAKAGTCKCAIADGYANDSPSAAPIVLIGDGLSDVCLGTRADFVFAKDKLLDFCRANAIAHRPFVSFLDVETQLLTTLREIEETRFSQVRVMELHNDAR